MNVVRVPKSPHEEDSQEAVAGVGDLWGKEKKSGPNRIKPESYMHC